MIEMIFQKILVCSFVTNNNLESIKIAFTLAQKFDSDVILLKCLHKESPTFGLFQTKSEKKKEKSINEKTQSSFDEVTEIAKNYNISLKTESVFVESVSEYITSYVDKNAIDLLVADSTPPLDINLQDHKDVVNRIYKNIECPVLTLK